MSHFVTDKKFAEEAEAAGYIVDYNAESFCACCSPKDDNSIHPVPRKGYRVFRPAGVSKKEAKRFMRSLLKRNQ